MAVQPTTVEGSGDVQADAPQELELADGTRLVSKGEERPARLDGDPDHAFTLADVQREGAEPFAGYVRLS